MAVDCAGLAYQITQRQIALANEQALLATLPYDPDPSSAYQGIVATIAAIQAALNTDLAAYAANCQTSTPGPTPGPSPGTGGGTTVVNIDLKPVADAINAFDYAFQVNFLPYFTGDLINAIKGIGGGLGSAALMTSLEPHRGLADVLDTISIDIGQFKEQFGHIFNALEPLGKAFLPGSDPPFVAWAATAGANSARTIEKERLGESEDWPHWIWDKVGALAKDIGDPFMKALPSALSLAHAPGKILGSAMASLLIGEVTKGVTLVQGSTLANATENATQLWETMYGLGMTAHLFAEVGELVHPFKQLGLPQAAAFAVDMSGFGRVGASIMGALTRAGVEIPMTYAALAQAKPEIPGFRQMPNMFRRGAMHDAEVIDHLAYHGYSFEFAQKFIESWYAAPSLGDLSLALQDADVDSDWVAAALKKHGYNPDDVDELTAGLERKILNPYRTRAISAAMSLHTKGLTSDQDLRSELESLDLRPEAIDLLAKAGAWDARATLVSDATTEFTTMYQSGLLDDQAFAVALTGLGYTEARSTILVAVQSVKRAGKIAAKKETAAAKVTSEFQKESIVLYRLQFDAGIIDADGYQAALIAIGLDQAVAQAIVSIDQIKQAEKTSVVKTSQAQKLRDQITRETIAALGDQYRKRLITIDQLQAGLIMLGLDARLASAIAAKEFALGVSVPKTFVTPPPEVLVEQVKARARTVILTEFKKGMIDEAQATDELTALPEDSKLVAQDIKLAIAQSYRTPRAVPETSAEKQTRTAQKETLLVEYRAGALDEIDLTAGLVAVGYSQDLSDALVSLEVAKKEAKSAAAAAKTAKKSPSAGAA